jgi:hypothetical protein
VNCERWRRGAAVGGRRGGICPADRIGARGAIGDVQRGIYIRGGEAMEIADYLYAVFGGLIGTVFSMY